MSASESRAVRGKYAPERRRLLDAVRGLLADETDTAWDVFCEVLFEIPPEATGRVLMALLVTPASEVLEACRLERQQVADAAVEIVDQAFEDSWVVEDTLNALRQLRERGTA